VSVDITLYWRPACGFCASLRRQLEQTDLTYVEVDIWSDPDAAATVRAYAGGNETVPTVVIGEPLSAGAVGLVNPSVREVLAAVERRASGSR
jgi:glutaredoxin